MKALALRRFLVGAVATLALVGGILHVRLWFRTYRHVPSQALGAWVVKVGFLLDGATALLVAAAVVGVLLAARKPLRSLVVLGAATAFQLGALVVLIRSRGSGVFGWHEAGYDSGAKSVRAVEIAGVAFGLAALAAEAMADRSVRSDHGTRR